MKTPKLISILLLFPLIFSSCGKETVSESEEKLAIAYAENLSDFSPLNHEAKNRRYLSNIYETAVRYDKSFNYEPSLALSWGRIDDLTWEFKLREAVKFHDQSDFDSGDFIYSIEAAEVNNIEKVEAVSANKVRIYTATPVPLLLNKLTGVYIMPENFSDFENPVGTAAYYFAGQNEDAVLLERFENYWGEVPHFKEVELKYIPNTEDRLNALLNGEVQFLVNVPPQYVSQLEDFKVVTFPSLEVSYLMFNFEGMLKDENLRNAIWYGLSSDYAERFGAGYLRSASQFAASGIFGHLSAQENREQNLETAQTFRDKIEGDVTLKLAIPEGLLSLAERVAVDLAEINIELEIEVLPVSDYEGKILSGAADVYFFGWKYDLADSSDFFEAVLHSSGNFNGMNYKNSKVDSLIEEAATVLEIKERREILEQIASEIIDERVGVPLFEAELIYGISPKIKWSTRLDGQVLAGEIR